MPLQIRRGPTADRVATIPLLGELVYDTTTGSVYVGNGVAVGGLPVTNFSVGDARTTTAKLFLGDSLSDNTVHSGVTFAYVGSRLQATVAQDLSNYIGLIATDQGFKGNLWADDSGQIIDSATKTIYGTLVAEGDILPDSNETHDLGSSTKRFKDIYLSGSSIYLGNAVITSTGSAINFPTGSTIGGQPVGINEGDTYNITVSGNVIGTDSTVLVNTSNGTFRGDLTGSVFADDSTMLVDGRDGVLRGTLIGALTGNVTGNLTGTASLATVASTVTLVPTDSSASVHYLTFIQNSSGNESVRSDTSLTYQPSTNTLAAGVLNVSTVNTTTVTATSVSATNLTGTNLFTSLIDSADSSAITVTPAIVFNSDVTVENELFIGGDVFPDTSESYNLGSYTKKFGKLYLTEGANALWIGNAAISGSGTTVNLPAGSTVGGSVITTSAGSNASTITVNTTGTSAEYYISFFDALSGDNLLNLNSNFKFNPGTNRLTVGNATIGTVTGNLTGNVTGNVTGNLVGSVVGDLRGSVFADDSTKLIDAVEGQFFGNLTGNVTGDLFGDLTSTSISLTEGVIRTVSTSESNIPIRSDNYTNVSNTTVNWRWFRSRGTAASPLRVQSNDHIGRIEFTAFNGTSTDSVAQIRVEAASGTVAGRASGLIRFLTADSDGTFATAMVISSNRNITMATGDLALTAGAVTAGDGFNTGMIRVADNIISTTATNADLELNPNGSGLVDFVSATQSTVGSAGVASPLPATPSTYFQIKLAGVTYVVPAYAVA